MGQPNRESVGGWESVCECRIDGYNAMGNWSPGVWSPASVFDADGGISLADEEVDDEQLDGLLARLRELSAIGELWEQSAEIEIECVAKPRAQPGKPVSAPSHYFSSEQSS